MTKAEQRGRLRVYLGVAPGVGKTYAMVSEGMRRAARGTDVLLAVVETHDRPAVAELVRSLVSGPAERPRALASGTRSLDVDGVIARRPEVALVDDLACRNPETARNARRWQDVEEILRAGIDVISTVNIDQLESLGDVVASITGVPQRENVPDHAVRAAEQIELVDMTPEALRRRMAHGNIYPADRVDAALSRYFRAGNLAALRELALLWLADRVDEGLERYRDDHHIAAVWAARERVLVALTGGPESETLLRRGARIAGRGAGGELHVVHVSASADQAPGLAEIARLRTLTEELGGSHHTVIAGDAAAAVLQVAQNLNATQIVLGVSRRRPWQRVLGTGVSDRIIAGSEDIDVLVVTHPYARAGSGVGHLGGALGRRRVATGWLLALLAPALLAVALPSGTREPALALAAMSFLALTVGCALVGGLWPAVTSAILGSFLLNWFFTAPHHTFTIAHSVNLVALLLFVVVAVAVASVVDKAARRSVQASAARHEADTLSMLNRTLLRSERDTRTLVELVRETFGGQAAALLRRHEHGGQWVTVAAAGDDPPTDPNHADAQAEVSDALRLALRGTSLQPFQRRELTAFATHLAVALEREELSERAAAAQHLVEGNKIRTALLAAVSHDLRTPLAGIKAAVSSLRSTDVEWEPEDEAELLEAIETSTDRLHAIVANLLDLSRLQTGSIPVSVSEVGLDDVVSRSVAELSSSSAVDLRLPADVPAVQGDAGLLDRIVANLVENALRHSPEGSRVAVTLSAVGDRVQLHVVDRGPGVPDHEKARMFRPFQRLGDADTRAGVGLGLPVAKGLTEALGGRLSAEDTPGGGLTMVVDLPAVQPQRVVSTEETVST